MRKKSFFLRVQFIVRMTTLLSGLLLASLFGGSFVVAQNFSSDTSLIFFRDLSRDAGDRYGANVAILPVSPGHLKEVPMSRGLTPLGRSTIEKATLLSVPWEKGYSVIYPNPLTESSRCAVWGGDAKSTDGFEQLYLGRSGDGASQYAVMHEVGHCIGYSFLDRIEIIENREFFDSTPEGLHVGERTVLHYQYLSEVFADLFALKSLYDVKGGMPEREARWLLRKRQRTASKGYLAYGGILPFITGYNILKSSNHASELAPGDFASEVLESILEKDRTAGLQLLLDGMYFNDAQSKRTVAALFGDVEMLL